MWMISICLPNKLEKKKFFALVFVLEKKIKEMLRVTSAFAFSFDL